MRSLTILITGLFLLIASPPAFCNEGDVAGADTVRGVDIEWYGHSCFLITAGSGAKILIDPFDPGKFPYSLPEGPVTLVFASHDHSDHNHLEGVDYRLAVKGGRAGAMVTDPLRAIPRYGTYAFSEDSTDYSLEVVPAFHDESEGEKRGPNVMSVWEVDGIRIVHMGDLGCELDDKQIEVIGRPDVLLIPVGGYYTIDAETARSMVRQLSARIVVPMHFKTKALGERIPIAGVDEFIKGWDKITIADGSVLTVGAGELPEGPEVVLLKYHGQAK